jgi:hypothetical protein
MTHRAQRKDLRVKERDFIAAYISPQYAIAIRHDAACAPVTHRVSLLMPQRFAPMKTRRCFTPVPSFASSEAPSPVSSMTVPLVVEPSMVARARQPDDDTPPLIFADA